MSNITLAFWGAQIAAKWGLFIRPTESKVREKGGEGGKTSLFIDDVRIVLAMKREIGAESPAEKSKQLRETNLYDFSSPAPRRVNVSP